MSKMNDLKIKLDEKFDIWAGSETWIPDFYSIDSEFKDYAIYRCDRKDKKGGGVIIACSIKIKSIELFTLSDKYSQAIAVRICSNIDIILICIYIPPSAEKLNFLEKLCDKLKKEKLLSLNIVIFGDFNLNFNKSDNKTLLNNLFNKLGFKQVIKFDTMLKHSSKLDLVFINNFNKFYNFKRAENISRSCDHYAITFDINGSKTTTTEFKKPFKLFKKCNVNAIKRDINNLKLDYNDSSENVVNNFYKSMQNTIDHNVPVIKSCNRHSKPKIITHLLIQKSHLSKTFLYNSLGCYPANRTIIYKKIIDGYHSLIKFYIDYFETKSLKNIIKNSDSFDKIYKMVKNFNKKSTPTVFSHNNQLIFDNNEIAEAF